MDWQRLFTDKILDRGHDYYLDDLVTDLHYKNDVLTATVHGTYDYDVRIRFNGDKIAGMDCTCPYADDGNSCKHLAAALFQWDDIDEDKLMEEDIAEDASTDNNVASLVMNSDSEIVRSFLIRVLEDDEKLLLRFKSIVVPGVSAEDVKKYKAQVNSIVRSYSGRYGFIDYSSARGFTRAMNEFLVDVVGMMMDNEDYHEAFDLTNHVFLTVANTEMDDSDGGSGGLASHCFDIWTDILVSVDITEKTHMLDWFTSHLDGSVIDYMEEYIEDIIKSGFGEKNFHSTLLAFADKKVQDSGNVPDSWSKRYQHGRWALYRLSLMESALYNWGELERYCIEHWASSDVRSYYVKKCLEMQEYERAIEVLEESMVLDSELPGLVSGYSDNLRALYKQTGNTTRYLDQLWKMVLNHKVGDFKVYRELKALYTEAEWKEQREKVFQALSRHYSIDSYYREEELYDRLLDSALRSRGLHSVNKHLDVLKNDYPEQLLQKYRHEVESMAERASDRRRYQEMVSILRVMRDIKGGRDVVNEITRDWRFNYSNRRAMMDELSRL